MHWGRDAIDICPHPCPRYPRYPRTGNPMRAERAAELFIGRQKPD